MAELVVVSGGATLLLDDAMAFVSATDPKRAIWLAADAPASASYQDSLDWLLPELGEVAAAPVSSDVVSPDTVARIESDLVAQDHAYPCDCGDERLSALVISSLDALDEPRYDGRCRAGTSQGAGRRLRFRSASGDDDFPIDTCLPIAAAIISRRPERVVAARSELWRVKRGRTVAMALGHDPVPIVEASVMVGSDGGRLRDGSRFRSVPDLRRLGYEAAAVRRLRERCDRSVPSYLTLAALNEVNRALLLDLPAEGREKRLEELLCDAGVPVAGQSLAALWDAVEPRIALMSDAVRFLGFLRSPWKPPEPPSTDRAELECLGTLLSEERPTDGEALGRVLDRLAGEDRGRFLDLRRVLRWAITGQVVAPPVATVWTLLGGQEALRRLMVCLGKGAEVQN